MEKKGIHSNFYLSFSVVEVLALLSKYYEAVTDSFLSTVQSSEALIIYRCSQTFKLAEGRISKTVYHFSSREINYKNTSLKYILFNFI